VRRLPLALVALVGTTCACANLLGYDDLAPREVDAEADVSDSASDAIVPTVARPPPRPTGTPAPSGKGRTVWLAVRQLYLGLKTHEGVVSDDAWREWGFDLDKVCTGEKESKENTGTCRRADGAEQNVLVDGDLCRDNNFGARLMPLIKAAARVQVEDKVAATLIKGNPTMLLRIDDLDDGDDDPYAPGALYEAADIKDPKWDGTDVRNVLADSVIDSSLDKSKMVLPKGYLSKGTWVSGDGDAFGMIVPFSGVPSVLPMVGGLLTLPLSTDRTPSGLATLAGAIPLASLDDFVRPVGLDIGICPGSPTYISLQAVVAKFPDLVASAKDLQDTTASCDSISVGMGAQFVRVQPPPAVEPNPPFPPGKCDAPGLPSVGSLVVLGDTLGSGSGTYAQVLRDDLTKKYGTAVSYTNKAQGGTKAVNLGLQVDSLPKALPGPVVVTITNGENELRAAWDSILAGTDAAARTAMTTNLKTALDKLLAPNRFGAGVVAHVYVANLYDPSDGKGDYGKLACKFAPASPPTDPFFKNWNDAIEATVTAKTQVTVDVHARFFGHGYRTTASWYSLADCSYPNNAGTDQLRRIFYEKITGAVLP